MMAINLPRYKTLAFAISSFYAGCAGALIYSIIGFFEPSNILSSAGYYYSLLHVEAKNAQTQWGACLMRTDDLADPASWRGWDGSAFSIVLDRGICPALQQDRIGKMGSSLSYNS